MTRILGLDVGEKRIGVALSDPDGILASPLLVLERKGEERDLEALLSLAQKHGVGRVVVGLPRSLDGSLGPQAQRVQAFIDSLSEKTGLPLEVWDERLSTVEAERLLRMSGVRRGKQKREKDALAAALILQGYLDRMRASGP